jgi:hypothetical protein
MHFKRLLCLHIFYIYRTRRSTINSIFPRLDFSRHYDKVHYIRCIREIYKTFQIGKLCIQHAHKDVTQ